jgi:bifunctional non-homologous end joining protein LigD
VRLWTRNGHDWSDRFPLISEAALRNRNSSFVIDGEAVLLGVDVPVGLRWPAFAPARSRGAVLRVDCVVSDGDDLRKLMASIPLAGLARSRLAFTAAKRLCFQLWESAV